MSMLSDKLEGTEILIVKISIVKVIFRVRCSEQAAATRKRFEEAAKAKEEADRAAAAARSQRRDYATGKLTAEEKAAKLAEMSSNAAAHEDSRTHRLKQAASKDAAARGEAAKHFLMLSLGFINGCRVYPGFDIGIYAACRGVLKTWLDLLPSQQLDADVTLSLLGLHAAPR